MNELRFECVPVIEEIFNVDETIKEFLYAAGVKECNKICFAAHELLINSIEAMNVKKDADFYKNIKIHILISDELMKFSINDWGGGISEDTLKKINSTSIEEISLEERGRGLLMIKLLIDEVYCRKELDGSYTYSITERRS